MNSKRSAKLLAFASFTLTVVFSFILIGILHNHMEGGLPAGVYALVAAIVGLSLLNLVQVMKTTAQSISADEYLKRSYAGDEAQTDQDRVSEAAGKEEENQQQLDPVAYEKKFLPQAGKKQELTKFTEGVLSNIARELDIVQGLFYVRQKESDTFTATGKFAYFGEQEPQDFELGLALTGQTAKNQKTLRLTKMPENYITVLSGLGSSSPNSLLLAPVIHEGKTIGLIELAAFKNFDRSTEILFNQLSETFGKQLAELL
jgi:transcriptional regulator with GAF, ATPase, and Fis domain